MYLDPDLWIHIFHVFGSGSADPHIFTFLDPDLWIHIFHVFGSTYFYVFGSGSMNPHILSIQIRFCRNTYIFLCFWIRICESTFLCFWIRNCEATYCCRSGSGFWTLRSVLIQKKNIILDTKKKYYQIINLNY